MNRDRLQLLEYGFVTILLIVGWFALASLSHNILVKSLLAWVGLGAIVLYWRWLLKNKTRTRQQ